MQLPAFLSRDPIRRAVGNYNCYMRPDGAGGCMRSRAHLSPQEEFEIGQRLLTAISERPKDWSFLGYTARDNKSGMEIWLGNGQDFVSIWKPRRIALRKGTQKILWNALHDLRHASEQAVSANLKKLLDAANQPERTTETVHDIKRRATVTPLA